MSDIDSSNRNHGGALVNPAKELVQGSRDHWNLPEGVVLAGTVSRAFAYIMDTIFVMGVLYLITSVLGGQAGSIVQAFNLQLLLMGGRGTALFVVDWFLIFGAHYLYHLHTGVRFSRTLAQRWMGFAVVREDGSRLSRRGWQRRAAAKLRYAIPLIGALWFGLRDLNRIHKRHTHQSSIDLKVGTIVVEGSSLPVSMRGHLR